jgi:hypothetical protein
VSRCSANRLRREEHMPQIIVTANWPAGDGEPAIMFRERVNVSDFESQHFRAQLAERLAWAVGDADEFEQRSARDAERRRMLHRQADAADRELAGVSAGPLRPVS